MEPVLKFVNVNKYYNNNVHALHNINLEIAAGEFISVIGPSGSGKSTLLRTVNRLIDVSDGEICLDGENITSIGGKKLRAVRRKVGMIFQNYNLVYRLSVLQNVLHGYLGYLDGIKGILGIYPEEEKLRAISLLEEMGLGAFCYNRAADLSGGQKQRVAMARMIASEPDILRLDEPFSALDSYLKWELEQEMRDMLAEVQKPVLFVSHNRDEVYRLCSVVSCIDHGKMEVIEKTKEFFHNPKTKTAAVLSGCKNISAAEIVDNNHIKALGWGITLCVSEIPEETKAVGIRAHSFYPVNAEQIPGKESAANESRVSVIQEGTGLKKYRNPVQEENIFKIEESRIIEDPFEWNISFRPSKESGWLQWKIAKTEQEDSPGPIPPALAVHAKDILLLKDNAYE